MSVFSAFSQVSLAGSWTQKKGDFLLIQSNYFYSTDTFYNADGTKSSTDKFSKYEFNPYIEYGLTDSITLGISDFIQQLSQENPTGAALTNFGHSGAEIFARFLLYQDNRHAIALQPLLKFKSHYSHAHGVKSGHKDVEFELALQAGRNFQWLGKRHYIDNALAYRKRVGPLANQFSVVSTIGFRLTDKFELMPMLQWTKSAQSLKNDGVTVSGQNNYDAVKAQLSLLYHMNDSYKLQMGAYQNIYARNTGGGHGILVNIWALR